MDSGKVLYVGKGSGYRWKQSLKRIEELSHTSKEIAEKWISGELELKSIKDKQKRRVILSFYRKVEDNLRFNPGIVSFATFAFIRHSLRSSMVTKAELVELAGLEDSGENDARIIEIRRVAGERALAALTSMRQVKAIWGV